MQITAGAATTKGGQIAQMVEFQDSRIITLKLDREQTHTIHQRIIQGTGDVLQGA